MSGRAAAGPSVGGDDRHKEARRGTGPCGTCVSDGGDGVPAGGTGQFGHGDGGRRMRRRDRSE